LNSSARIIWAGLICLLLGLNTACTQVSAGTVAVVVGAEAGEIQAHEIRLRTRRIWYNPFTESVYTFSRGMQRAVWPLGPADDDTIDTGITFNTAEGVVVRSGVEFGYTTKPGRIPYVFVALGRGDATIGKEYMRAIVRSRIARCAQGRTLDEIHGPQKNDITHCALGKLRADPLLTDNYNLEYLNFVGAFRYDEDVQNVIWARIQGKYSSLAAIESAETKARLLIIAAEAARDAKFLAAEGNVRLGESLSNNVLVYEQLRVMKAKCSNDTEPSLVCADEHLPFALSIE
jgi:hypothetical protein